MTAFAIGDRVWWEHTKHTVRYGIVKAAEERPGVLPDDDDDLLYLDAAQLQRVGDLPDGQYGWITDADYHANQKRLSSTGARLLLPPSVPALFKYAQDHPRRPNRNFDVGHVAHRLTLGKGAEFEVLDPDIHGRKKDGTLADNPRATADWKLAEATVRAEGKTPIHVDDYTAAQRMADAIHAHEEAGDILAECQPEMSLYATPFAPGVPLKARPDVMKMFGERLWMGDVKTAVTADPNQFARKAADLGYHIQAAFYRLVAQLLGLDDDPAFVFMVVEKEPPHLVSVVEFDAEAMREGTKQVWRAINTYAECQSSGRWPGYPSGIQPISLPSWATRRETVADLLEGTPA